MFSGSRSFVVIAPFLLSLTLLISGSILPVADWIDSTQLPQATITSTSVQHTTVTQTVFETQRSTLTTTRTNQILSGTTKLWPDSGVRPPPVTSTPFHVGFGFEVKAGCGYGLGIQSDKSIYLVKILTPDDWEKKRADPEDPTIHPLETWKNVRTIDVPMNLVPGQYVLYMYSFHETLSADYYIRETCGEVLINTAEIGYTTVQTSEITSLIMSVESPQFWLFILPVLLLVIVVVVLVKRNADSRRMMQQRIG